MDTQLAVRAAFEKDLFEKLKELAQLQMELVDRELFLTNLRSETLAFESRYMREVGALYLKLDEWNARVAKVRSEELYMDSAKIQEELSELVGDDSESQYSSQSRRPSWFRSRRAPSSFAVADGPAQAVDFRPSMDLRAAYRDVAKRVHPDFAVSERDRRRREALMKEVNSAYQRGDLDALRRILEEHEQGVELPTGNAHLSGLERVVRQIAQIRARLERIELEITSVFASDIGNLKQRADAAQARGHDLLSEMADGVRSEIDKARERFYSSREEQR
ncbi:MAG TPA: J domain-containing protein [Candidatus Acidoferrum sp.]|nr:J domain-containing protein [Candidatus Acidoferrum sp.]